MLDWLLEKIILPTFLVIFTSWNSALEFEFLGFVILEQSYELQDTSWTLLREKNEI